VLLVIDDWHSSIIESVEVEVEGWGWRVVLVIEDVWSSFVNEAAEAGFGKLRGRGTLLVIGDWASSIIESVEVEGRGWGSNTGGGAVTDMGSVNNDASSTSAGAGTDSSEAAV
jgi:hypothetical protein